MKSKIWLVLALLVGPGCHGSQHEQVARSKRDPKREAWVRLWKEDPCLARRLSSDPDTLMKDLRGSVRSETSLAEIRNDLSPETKAILTALNTWRKFDAVMTEYPYLSQIDPVAYVRSDEGCTYVEFRKEELQDRGVQVWWDSSSLSYRVRE